MRSSALEIIIQSDVTSNRLQVLGVSSILPSRLRKLVRIAIILLALVNTHCFTPQLTKAAGPTPIPQLDTWQADMLPFGDLQCQYFLKGVYNGALGQNLYGDGDPFYDGARVFYQIRDFTNDPKWDTCADKAAKQYRETQIDWTGQYGYGAAGWNNFSTGLRLHYQRTGDQRSKDAVHMLATHGWAGDGGPSWGYPYAREIAYAIKNHMDDEALGAPHRARLDELVNTALQHLNDMVVTKKALTSPIRGEDGEFAGITPFMVGLEGQALIQYYEKYKDARILPMLKKAADVLYNEVTPLGLRIWNPQKGAFLYDTSWGGGKDYGYPGLNQLIAPLYAWVYEMTGETKYRDQGDEIFRQGIHRTHCASVGGGACLPGEDNGAYLWSGKQFNQSYMWSFEYVAWRLGASEKNLPPSPPRNMRIQ